MDGPRSMGLQEQIAFLKHTLDTISSSQILSLDVGLMFHSDASLELTLTQLTALRDLDAVLARQHFSNIKTVNLRCDKFPKIPSLPSATESSTRLSSQAIPSTGVPAYRQRIKENPKFAQDVIKRKLRDELKQFNARGILAIGFWFWTVPAVNAR